MHGDNPSTQLVEIELSVIGMEGHGHVTHLPPFRSGGQEMVPRMVESEKHGKLFRRDKDLKTVKIDTLGMFLQTILLDGSIYLMLSRVKHFSAHTMDLEHNVAKLNIIVASHILFNAPSVSIRKSTQHDALFICSLQAE